MITLEINNGVLAIIGERTDYITAKNGDFEIRNGSFFLQDKIFNKEYWLGPVANVSGFATEADLITYLSTFFSNSGTTKLADANGNLYTVQNPLYTRIGTNALALDAWGRQKVLFDKSIIHGMFSFNVPVSMWKETYNGTEQEPTIATSVNGALSIKSGATLNDVNVLDTYRHPRYEPNRGHLYSTACILPTPTASGVREFGIFTAQNGAFFRLKSDGKLYAVVRTYYNSEILEDEKEIDTTGIDLSKGNVYDIQFQWRGVGNYRFFINLQESYCFDYLGTLTKLSMSNPALPVAFKCENLGDNVEIIAGCVDVTSEGGSVNGKIYGSLSPLIQSGQIAVGGGFNVPMLAIRSKLTIGSRINTRDTLALLLSAFSDQKSFVRVWATRDFTAITENDQSWADYGDGHLEFLTYDVPDVTTPMTFDTAKASLQFGNRVAQDVPFETSAIFDGRTEIWITPGDMLVFTLHRENGGAFNGGITFEFSEEI